MYGKSRSRSVSRGRRSYATPTSHHKKRLRVRSNPSKSKSKSGSRKRVNFKRGNSKPKTSFKLDYKVPPASVNTTLHVNPAQVVSISNSHKALPFHNRFRFIQTKQKVNGMSKGSQNVFTGVAMFTQYQLSGSTSTTRSDMNKWDTSPWLLNPVPSGAVNAIYPGPAANFEASDHIFIDGFYESLSVLNLESSPVKCEVYWMLCMGDSNSDPIAAWTICNQEEAYTQAAAVSSNATATLTATSGQIDYFEYGSDPFRYKNYKKFWKCIASNTFNIDGGCQFDLNKYFKVSKDILRKDLDSWPTAYRAKWTIIPLIIGRAGLVGVANDASSTSTEVTYGSCTLGITTRHEIIFAGLTSPRVNTTRHYAGTIVGGIQVEKEIDMTDEAQAVVTA